MVKNDKRLVRSISDVPTHHLCSGCGVCAAAASARYRMADIVEDGRRPLPILNGAGRAMNDDVLLEICPGYSLRHTFNRSDPVYDRTLMSSWGAVIEVWEGAAGDEVIRRAGSSGGVATALSLYCLEQGGMYGVLHTAARNDVPYLNTTVMSTTREELLARTGSRYAPASPCEGLGLIEQAPAPCVFIGKPCDVAAAISAAKILPALAEKLGLTIAFFCAGTPSTQGTLDLLKKVGVENPAAILSLRYRGNGWPGRWTVAWDSEDGTANEASLSYEESWGFLQKYRQWRCRICPDHTGEFADIAVGDPWYRSVEPNEAGKSLIVVRTRRGQAMLRAAAEAGYIVLDKQDPALLSQSQPNLLKTRGRLWGQLLAMRMLGISTPRYFGFPMAHIWRSGLTLREKVSSIAGTWRRLIRIRRARVFRLSESTVQDGGDIAQ